MTFAVAGIQARMSSSRLPGKSLADVAGVPLIQRVVDRVRAARRLDEVLVVTSVEASDDPLAEYCEGQGIPVRRGPLEDVYARYELLADEFEPRYLARITGDCPLVDPQHIDRQLDTLEEEDADLAPVPGAEHVFPGQGVMSLRAFRAAGSSTDPRDREHVGSFYFVGEGASLRRVNLRVDPELANGAQGVRLAVDEQPDLEFVRHVFERFDGLAPLSEVLGWLRQDPWPSSLNADVRDSRDNRELQAQREELEA